MTVDNFESPCCFTLNCCWHARMFRLLLRLQYYPEIWHLSNNRSSQTANKPNV